MPRTGTCEIRRGREEHGRPKKSDRCIVVCSSARLTKFKVVQYSRSPGDRGKVFASLPFVRSGGSDGWVVEGDCESQFRTKLCTQARSGKVSSTGNVACCIQPKLATVANSNINITCLAQHQHS
jgi:hypothetical protein